jgi:hypothetical protein
VKFLDRGDDEYGVGDFAAGMGRRAFTQTREIGRRVVNDLVDTARLAQRATIPGMVSEAVKRFSPPRADDGVRYLDELPWWQSASSDPGVAVAAAAAGAIGPGGKGKAVKKVGEVIANKAAPKLGFDVTPEYMSSLSVRDAEKMFDVKATVGDPKRILFPGIYKDPRTIADEAGVLAAKAPESGSLTRLFDTTRSELAQIADRPGNIENPFSLIPGYPKKPKGNPEAQGVMTPENERRILSVLDEVRTRQPNLWTGMKGWYPLDPMYQRILQLVGGDEKEAMRRFNNLNSFGGIESPNLAVPMETRRAFAANYMAEGGRFDEWAKYGGIKGPERTIEHPQDILSVPGRIGHQRASSAQRRVFETGEHGMDSPKAPLYISASNPPVMGFQTALPVGDAHFVRGIGLPDVRAPKKLEGLVESISTPELTTLGPWWSGLARKAGVESVPGQAIAWGGFSPQTGVKSPISAPKLEIIGDLIEQRAAALGRDPREVRDAVLMGKEHLGFADPALLGATAAGAGAGMYFLSRD